MKLLTWNIQAGIATARYSHYLTGLHRQVLHTSSKSAVLETIADAIRSFDVVCLQEVDLGGRRAGYRCQATVIAEHSGHGHVVVQENRVVRGVSRHGNAILSHHPISRVRDLKLPGRIAGRGGLLARIDAETSFEVACVHLSLGKTDQMRQLAFLADKLPKHGRWVMMGDFNCSIRSQPIEWLQEETGAQFVYPVQPTYPSWRPAKDYDHILPGPALDLTDRARGQVMCSDHLSLSARLETA